MGLKETFLAQNIVLLGGCYSWGTDLVLPGPKAIHQGCQELYWLSHLLD